jgi:hypothetical protein
VAVHGAEEEGEGRAHGSTADCYQLTALNQARELRLAVAETRAPPQDGELEQLQDRGSALWGARCLAGALDAELGAVVVDPHAQLVVEGWERRDESGHGVDVGVDRTGVAVVEMRPLRGA